MEGRGDEYGGPELTKLKRRADGDRRPTLSLPEPYRPEDCLFSPSLNFCLIRTQHGTYSGLSRRTSRVNTAAEMCAGILRRVKSRKACAQMKRFRFGNKLRPILEADGASPCSKYSIFSIQMRGIYIM